MSTIMSRATKSTLIIGATASATLLSPEQFIIDENIPAVERVAEVQDQNIIDTINKNLTYDSSYSKDFVIVDINTDDEYLNIERELYGYLQLLPDWDFKGAIIPDKGSIEAMSNILKKLELFQIPSPKPMLASDGEVCLYWKKDNLYIEIGAEDKDHFSYLVDDHAHPFGEDDCKIENFYSTKLFSSLNTILS